MAVLKGTLDVLVLKALTWGPMHGFEITSWLEERGLLAAEWGMTRNGRRARYYALTVTGRATLREEAAALADDVAALTAVLTARKAAP